MKISILQLEHVSYLQENKMKNKNNKSILKEFFIPSIFKIILFFVLLIISFIPHNGVSNSYGCYSTYAGLPLNFYSSLNGFECVGFPPEEHTNYYYLFLIINVVFWYLISCLAILIINKIRNK